MLRAFPYVPLAGQVRIGVAIFSYDRKVRVGFKADARVVPDVAKVVHTFDAEMDQLTRIARAA